MKPESFVMEPRSWVMEPGSCIMEPKSCVMEPDKLRYVARKLRYGAPEAKIYFWSHYVHNRDQIPPAANSARKNVLLVALVYFTEPSL